MKGSCLCGRVRYEIDGELGPAIYCHCRLCRKASGSAFATNASVAAQAFRFVAGESLVRGYESSPGQLRKFCSGCGSPILKTNAEQPDTLRIRLGSLDGAPDVSVVGHIFVGSKASWHSIEDDLPQQQ